MALEYKGTIFYPNTKVGAWIEIVQQNHATIAVRIDPKREPRVLAADTAR